MDDEKTVPEKHFNGVAEVFKMSAEANLPSYGPKELERIQDSYLGAAITYCFR